MVGYTTHRHLQYPFNAQKHISIAALISHPRPRACLPPWRKIVLAHTCRVRCHESVHDTQTADSTHHKRHSSSLAPSTVRSTRRSPPAPASSMDRLQQTLSRRLAVHATREPGCPPQSAEPRPEAMFSCSYRAAHSLVKRLSTSASG
jgi:hypothetical protein